MGGLHQGHAQLVRQALRESNGQGAVAVSIFVNPKQFAPGEDFDKYPRQLDNDVSLLQQTFSEETGSFQSPRLVIFAPAVDEMYPQDFGTSIRVKGDEDFGEGKLRPGFFSGVATVVSKLLLMTGAGRLYLGEKDAMQVMILTRLVRDLAFDTRVVTVPTVRDPESGLALSSRNVYMSNNQRQVAGVVYKALCAGKGIYQQSVENGIPVAAKNVKNAVLEVLSKEPNVTNVAYLDVFCCWSGRLFDGDDLVPIQRNDDLKKTFDLKLAISPVVGQTRLVDVVALS
eukprot:TRINITY_DN6767_c0_g1_i1.p1 TRINITY_DN6767_c0_g1~~TRINITY_DN6767_c0_g1_i1.p1  ORF type:complete len:285 (+),score=54.81 TRINITY_DN6767_c0_g1_i1:131-985(+)